MSTRSRIGIENLDGTVTSVYCHFDGYFSNNGVILQKEYQDEEKVKQLIALGDLSSLHETIEGTTAYCRDRDEGFSQREDISVEAYFKSDIEEYGYMFTQEGEWIGKHFNEPSVINISTYVNKPRKNH